MPVASQEGDAPLAPRQHVLALGAAIFAGIGIPLLASSPTVSGVSLALALILLLAAPGRRHLVADFARGARSPLGLAILLTFILWLPGMGESLDSGRSIGVWGRMAGFVFVYLQYAKPHIVRGRKISLRYTLRTGARKSVHSTDGIFKGIDVPLYAHHPGGVCSTRMVVALRHAVV